MPDAAPRSRAGNTAVDAGELLALWRRRGSLDEAGWTRLYQLVMAWLDAHPVRIERAAVLQRETIDGLRQSFFVDKILLPAAGLPEDQGPPPNLLHFYKNYLIDHIRAIERRRQELLPADDALPDHLTAALAAQPDGAACVLETAANEAQIEPLTLAADGFLQAAEDWVVVYLALHFCRGRDRIPLVQIHQLFQIPSYHYKAAKLGIAPPRGGFGREGFAGTMLGTWLTSNDVALDEDNEALIRLAFDLLCRQAFAEAGRRALTAPEPQR